VLCFILLVPFTAKSQMSVMDREYIPTYIGLTVGVGLVSYTGTVSAIYYGDDGVKCVDDFNSKSGFELNFLFGLKVERKISRYFDIYASLLYEGRSSVKFDPLDYTGYVYVDAIDDYVPAHLNRTLDAKINIFSITPMIKYKPFDFDFGILVGPSFAFMVSDELNNKETILEPAELFYKTGGKEITLYSGEIESKNSFLFDLKFGLSCGIMLTEEIKLSPEIFYVLPLTKVCSEGDWKISSIQFLVSVSYGF
jgi:hypothetical protein